MFEIERGGDFLTLRGGLGIILGVMPINGKTALTEKITRALCVLLTGLIVLAALTMTMDAATQDEKICVPIPIDEEGRFVLEMKVEGRRGILTFPAIIDTGATNTLIPSYILQGVGIRFDESAIFKTASSDIRLKSGTVDAIYVAGEVMKNVRVYSSNPKSSFGLTPFITGSGGATFCAYGDCKKPEKKEEEEEMGIMGMSELKHFDFSFSSQSGEMTLCL